MARTQQQQFSTIRTEGALLPPDVLQQIASGKAEGLRPADYHLPEGYKLNEAITQSWDLLKKHWKTFQEARAALSDTDTGTEITNKHWLLPLFRELDYGHLATSPAPQIEDRSYPIERFYNHTPIHLVGCNLPLDRRTKGARGAATASPHSMVQEFLNRSEGHVWAIVTNGLRLRLLRDNVALSRQAFVEFDLEAMMEGEVYPDFALLWLLLHQSRLEATKPEDCWLEAWSKLARESGTRILKQLRESVRTAIEALGQGFVSHVRNDALREKLRSGTLSGDDYYRQLLRIVYRLLFLFVAEDRDLLHVPGTSDTTRDRYRRFYSLSRLRDMALKLRGSKHGDLWHGLSLVFKALGSSDGCHTLGLTGLGSFLWTPAKTPDLNGPHEAADGRAAVEISNDDLLSAVHALAYVEQDGILRSVDYRNLGSEELGSVYESLLELHPDIEIDAQRFSLDKAAGNQRKTSGSYYTPDSLVQCLLDSALDPVVEDRIKGKKGADAEAAILDLTVCDPACGSGHFLIAAAHRLARHVARIRTGESEPSPDDHQTALRDVISRCIYGVDLNPMAVELCKVSLWMEAIEPGKPLSFLDHHVKCGNSLLGVTPRLLREGIPEDAFKAIEGDDKDVVRDLKKRHKQELKDRTGGVQSYLFTPYLKLGNLGEEFVRVTTDPSDTAADVARKASLYADLVERADYLNAKLLADTWCSAFVWKKDKTDLGKACPTERDFRECETNPHSLLPDVRNEVARLADEFSFFHWHLAFPEVFHVPAEGKEPENERMGWDGGFDVMLGNPPWEKIQIEEKNFFAESYPSIASASAASRKKQIAALEQSDASTFTLYSKALRSASAQTHLIRHSNSYPLTGHGNVTTHSVFIELTSLLFCRHGRAGLVAPSGLATQESQKQLFSAVVEAGRLASLFDFENADALFAAVDRRFRFCLLCLAAPKNGRAADFAFFLRSPKEITNPESVFSLTKNQLSLFSPNTGSCPTLKGRREASLLEQLYRRFPVIKNEQAPASHDWQWSSWQMFNETHERDLLAEPDGANPEALRVYEAKLTHQFDHRHASYIDGASRRATIHLKQNPEWQVIPRYYVNEDLWEQRIVSTGHSHDWILGFRRITNATNERTAIFSVLPRSVCGSQMPVATTNASACLTACLLACVNSFAFDFAARRRVGGTDLNHFIVHQLPAITKDRCNDSCSWSRQSFHEFCVPRVVELTCTATDLLPFAQDCGYPAALFRWDSARRHTLRAELDAAFFLLGFGTAVEWQAADTVLHTAFSSPRNAVDYILETFPIVKRKDVAKYGSYRTKERILAIYDEMAECIAKGTEWKSPLDPPPGDPQAAWTEEEMEMWRQGRGDELIEKYGLLDDADEPDDSDANSDSEDPADAEAEAVE